MESGASETLLVPRGESRADGSVSVGGAHSSSLTPSNLALGGYGSGRAAGRGGPSLGRLPSATVPARLLFPGRPSSTPLPE